MTPCRTGDLGAWWQMKAQVGDSLVAESNKVDTAPGMGRSKARGEDGGPPYVVRWGDGYEGPVYPGADSHVVPAQR